MEVLSFYMLPERSATVRFILGFPWRGIEAVGSNGERHVGLGEFRRAPPTGLLQPSTTLRAEGAVDSEGSPARTLERRVTPTRHA